MRVPFQRRNSNDGRALCSLERRPTTLDSVRGHVTAMSTCASLAYHLRAGRTNDVIAKFLPPKEDVVVFCALTEPQKELYRRICEDASASSFVRVSAARARASSAAAKLQQRLLRPPRGERAHSHRARSTRGKRAHRGLTAARVGARCKARVCLALGCDWRPRHRERERAEHAQAPRATHVDEHAATAHRTPRPPPAPISRPTLTYDHATSKRRHGLRSVLRTRHTTHVYNLM